MSYRPVRFSSLEERKKYDIFLAVAFLLAFIFVIIELFNGGSFIQFCLPLFCLGILSYVFFYDFFKTKKDIIERDNKAKESNISSHL